MIAGIDHLVIAVEDPDSAAAVLERTLGLRVTGGGRHDTLGTFNRLVWLGDSYLELIGVAEPEVAAGSWLGRPVLGTLRAGGGLATWAVAVDDLDAALRWTAADIALSGPFDGERRRPDGRIVRWRLAHPEELSPTSPFLIEHDMTAAEWTPDERRERANEAHPVGGTVRLAGLEVASVAPPASAAALRRLLAATVEPDGRRAVKVRIGEQAIRLVQPGGEDDARAVVELVADVPLRRRSARLGDCEIRLRGMPAPAVVPTGDEAAPAADPVG